MQVEREEMLIFRSSTELLISDVDDTLAYTYTPASLTITNGLNAILKRGVRLFLISGQGLGNIKNRIIDKIEPAYKRQILVGTCSGAELWGFDCDGNELDRPFYSKYEDLFDESMKSQWRDIVRETIAKFGLRTYPTMPKPDFRSVSDGAADAIMYEDRGAQITFELVNSCDLSTEQMRYFEDISRRRVSDRDLRRAIIEYANEQFTTHRLPVRARLAGNFAIDFAVEGVTKTTAVRFALTSEICSQYFSVSTDIASCPGKIEIWGDKFSVCNGGTDRHICEALDPRVRAIDFRQEHEDELPKQFNIRIWDGEKVLCEAAEEYMIRSGIVCL